MIAMAASKLDQTAMEQAICIRVQSGRMAARQAICEILPQITDLGIDVEDASLIELVMAEILNNIVEHAYLEQENAGLIEIMCTIGASGLVFDFWDQGQAMPDGKTPLSVSPDLNVDVMDMPEGGFGWFMIHALTKDVQYRREDDKNHLRLRIAISVPDAQV